MDRLVLESDPHRVLEGLAIAAYAIGAAEGYLYIRAEYPLAVRHMRAAIRQADGARLARAACSLEVREGAGAFVCGEETALIQSLEGKRGMPKLRPPYPVERGFRGKPTLINNVETLACVPWIIRHGAGAFAALGTGTSRGTKVFALAGKINRGGLIEVPMGITIREVVEEIGGGIKQRARVQGRAAWRAVRRLHPGAPGRYAHRLRRPGRDRRHHGLGRPGGARRPRLHGGYRPLLPEIHAGRILRQVHLLPHRHQAHAGDSGAPVRGQGPAGRSRESSKRWPTTSAAAACAASGQTAPNPVLTTLRYFREEYEAHLPSGAAPPAAARR